MIGPIWGVIPRQLYLNKSTSTLCLALTRACNLRCCFCPYKIVENNRMTHMPDEIFDRVVQAVGEASVKSIMLSPNLGEPLLAPGFLEKISRLRKAGVENIEVTTNGTLFHKFGVDRLLSSA